MKICSVFCSLLIGISCSADFRHEFSENKNPLDELQAQESVKEKFGKEITWKKGILKTGRSNFHLYDPQEFRKGRITLTGHDQWKSTVGIIKSRKDNSAYYALDISPSAGKVTLIRHLYPNSTKRQIFQCESGHLFSISLDFDGKTIIAWVNGKKIAEIPDDGLVRSGYAGIRGFWWSNVQLKTFSVSSQIQKKGSAGQAKTVRGVKRIDPTVLRSWDISKTFRRNSGMRSEVSLNWFWEFQPGETRDAAYRKDEGVSGFFPVPGYWSKGSPGNFMRNAEGAAVTRWNGIAYQKGGIGVWYRRTFVPPAESIGKKTELILEDVCGNAEIRFNGFEIARKNYHEIGVMRVDLTGRIKPGVENELLIHNDSAPGSVAGLGNVYLKISPPVNFGDVRIKTSVSEKKLDLEFHGASAPADARLKIQIRDRKGKELFQKETAFASRSSFQWMPPVLWTPDTPELYFLDLTLSGKDGSVLDHETLRFGFREFSLRNGSFQLNGMPIILKAETAARQKSHWWGLDFLNDRALMRPLFESYKKLNLNCSYLAGPPSRDVLDLADEMGIMVIVKGMIPSHGALDMNEESTMKRLEKYLQDMTENPVYYRHPSQIGFLIDIWYGFNAGCTNPYYVGNPEKDPNIKNGIPLLRMNRLNRMAGLYKKYFPEMECFTGGSGKVGNIYGTHVYHTWGAPSAELRAFFEEWAKERRMPIFVGETFLPYIGSFYDLQNFRGISTPYITENTVRILGPDAYRFRLVSAKRPFHDFSSRGWFWNTSEAKKNGLYGFPPDAFSAVTAKYIDEIVPGWRYHDLTGYGMFDYAVAAFSMQNISPSSLPISRDYSDYSFKPEAFSNGNAIRPVSDPSVPGYDFRPLLAAAPFARAMSSVTAAIFDKPSDPLLQNHSGYSGEILEKSVIIFNDSPEKVHFRLSLYLKDPQGRMIRLEDKDVSAKPFEHKLIPVRIPLPETRSRSEWTLHADLAGTKTIRMSFPIQVFARRAEMKLSSPVYLFDPEGILAKKLSGRIPFKTVKDPGNFPEKGILIVGRGALSGLSVQPDWKNIVEKGLNVLVMEQHPESSPELMYIRTRQAFINAPAHPVFEGLCDADFQLWQDSFSIAPAKGKGGAGVNWSAWGNRNMVASYVFRRPQHGNLISLLVSGFDLFQSPLMESRFGKGMMIASQLEITDRLGTDPAPTRLFDNILHYLDYPVSERRILFFGGSKGLKFLETFRVSAETVETLSGDTLKQADTLVIADPDFSKLKRFRMELNDFVYFGGKVFYLHLGGKFDSSWLPFTMGMGTRTSPRALLSGKADGVWLNGFGNSELYWRDPVKIPVFSKIPEQFDSADPAVLIRNRFGSGEWIFTTLHPDLFGKTAASGKTVRLLSALFTSLGAKISAPAVPYLAEEKNVSLDLSERKWEFAADENQVGLKEDWHLGKGNARWLKGLIADGVEVRVGQPFETFLMRDYNGCAWYRLTFDLPDEILNAPEHYFFAGAIDDYDEVYLNGTKIGSTGKETPKYWEVNRNYRIPDGLLKRKNNFIAVRVFDVQGGGGIVKGPVGIFLKKSHSKPRIWTSPWPEGARRDYEYKSDIVRMY